VGFLTWLGYREGKAGKLDPLLIELRAALPEDETVVVRYVAIVVALLGHVAYVDGQFSEREERALRRLLAKVSRLEPPGVDAVCNLLRGGHPFTEEELEKCYREIKSLCDGHERLEVLRLVGELAFADGEPKAEERAALARIAEAIGVPSGEIPIIEAESRAALQARPSMQGLLAAQPPEAGLSFDGPEPDPPPPPSKA
jgi:DnaJ like chaperone protein